MKLEELKRDHPDLYFLEPGDPSAMQSYLTESGVLSKDETILTCDRAGDGNMNCTIRVRTDRNSYIVKQSRPWVEKYPQFAAPWDRACREAEFYQLVSTYSTVAGFMPSLLFFDQKNRVLVLEDIGEGSDYTSVYRGAEFSREEIGLLAGFLSALHNQVANPVSGRNLVNREMRELNARHIFFIPLTPNNGLDLESIATGLEKAALDLLRNQAFVHSVAALSTDYLSDGPCLLHGDFFPGSLLHTSRGPKVIDPEFGYFGYAEFDVSVFVAHLILARQKVDRIQWFLEDYRKPDEYNVTRFLKWTGVEIMRRLIGYAQLPLGHAVGSRIRLLELSRRLVMEPDEGLILGDEIQEFQIH